MKIDEDKYYWYEGSTHPQLKGVVSLYIYDPHYLYDKTASEGHLIAFSKDKLKYFICDIKDIRELTPTETVLYGSTNGI